MEFERNNSYVEAVYGMRKPFMLSRARPNWAAPCYGLKPTVTASKVTETETPCKVRAKVSSVAIKQIDCENPCASLL